MTADDNPAASCTTVYYNGACPVCDAGIRRQRAQMHDCSVTFVDIDQQPDIADALGIDIETLRERLHVRDADGAMQVGDRAFVTLWAQTPGQRYLASVVRHAGWITGPLYKAVARLLYRWNRRRGHW